MMRNPAGLAFQSFGVRVVVRAEDPAWLVGFAERLPPRSKPIANSTRCTVYSLVAEPRAGRAPKYVLTRGGEKIRRSRDLATIRRAWESDLHFHIARSAPRWLFVHAGVVGWNGCAIVIPGRTLSGKSTLVAALVRAGAEYYSDEYAVFDGRGRLHPYPRPIALRPPGSKRARPRDIAEFGGRAGTKPLPAGLVVITEYREGARWRPRRRSQAVALMALFDNTLVAEDRPDFALDILERVVKTAAALEGTRGEATATADALLSSAIPAKSRRRV